MNLTPRGHEERALPFIWKDGVYSSARIDWYVDLILFDGGIKGGPEVMAEFLAAMLMESSLDNLILGNNAKNGSDNTFVGVGWCQLDTGYHVANLAAMHEFRSDPLLSLHYVLSTRDLSRTTGKRTWFNEERWHAWTPENIDPDDTWSPYAACLNAFESRIS